MQGTGSIFKGRDLLSVADSQVRLVPGVFGTDSKGGFDLVMVNESPLLGLSNMRAAIQAYQLKQAIRLCHTKLIWLASDWNLGEPDLLFAPPHLAAQVRSELHRFGQEAATSFEDHTFSGDRQEDHELKRKSWRCSS